MMASGSQRRQLRGADVGRIDAARRPDGSRKSHRPGAEPGAHVSDRHAGFQLKQLHELRHFEVGSLDLPVGQAGLLCSEPRDQHQHETDRNQHSSHDWLLYHGALDSNRRR
jgi:hypothetical protein